MCITSMTQKKVSSKVFGKFHLVPTKSSFKTMSIDFCGSSDEGWDTENRALRDHSYKAHANRSKCPILWERE